MKINILKGFMIILPVAALVLPVLRTGQPERVHSGWSAPEDFLECEPSLPIELEFRPTAKPLMGRITQFEVRVDSRIDPDLIREVRMEYDLPWEVRRTARLLDGREALHKSGQSRLQLALIIPDGVRYELRARLVITLDSGRRLSQTATCWVDLGEEDPPEGMIGRIVDSDGEGIRIYRGLTLEEER